MFSRSSCWTDNFLCASNKDSKYLDNELLSCHTSILKSSGNSFLLQRTHRNCIFSKWLALCFLLFLDLGTTDRITLSQFVLTNTTKRLKVYMANKLYTQICYIHIYASCFKNTDHEKILHVLLYDKKMAFHSSIYSFLTLTLSALFKPPIFPISKYRVAWAA